MKHANDSSDIDSRETDVLFSNASSLKTVLDPDTAPMMTQSMMTWTTGALWNTFRHRPKRTQKNHTAQFSRPEFLEVRSLLSGDSLDVYERREVATQVLNEATNAMLSAQENFDAVQMTLEDLYNLLTQETATQAELQIALKASKNLAVQLEIDFVKAQESVRTRTMEESTARIDLQSAETSLETAMRLLQELHKDLEKALRSTQLVASLRADIASAQQRVAMAVQDETDAANRLQNEPDNILLQNEFLAAKDRRWKVETTERNKILILHLKLSGATRQMENDLPNVESARNQILEGEAVVQTCTDICNEKRIAINTASQAHNTAIEEMTRLRIALKQARWDVQQIKIPLRQSGSRIRITQNDIAAIQPTLQSAQTVLAQTQDACGIARAQLEAIQADIDILEARALFQKIDDLNERIALLELEPDRSDEITALRSELQALQEHPAYIAHITKIHLIDIDAVTHPWSPAGASDLFRATEERGQQLINAAKEISIMMSSSASWNTELQDFLNEVVIRLSASLDEWTTVQERLLDPRSGIDELSSEILACAPRMMLTFPQTSLSTSTLSARFRSPYDQTYLEIDDRSGQSHRVIRQTLSHAGGTMETNFSALFERMTNVGGGEFTVRMYKDESKNLLLSTVGGYFNPDSNIGSVESQSGFDTMGSKSLLELPELGGKAALQSWQGMQNGVPSMTVEEGGLSSRGGAWTLDLHGAEHLVTNVSFTATSENPDAPITVRFYRGTELIGLDTVASGSIVNYLDTEGITSVLLTNPMREMSTYARQFLDYFNTADGQWQERRSTGGAAATFFSRNSHIPVADRAAIVTEAYAGYLPYEVTIADLVIAGNVHRPQVEAEAPSIGNNPDLGRAAHPYWGQSGDTLRRGPSPGYLAVGRFSESAYGVRRDINKYSAVRITGTNGVAKINYVAYHTQASDTRLSPEYYEIYGNTVILKPGAPEQIVIYFDKEGGGVQGLNIDVEHRESMTREEIMPPEGMALRTDILAIRNPNAGEGVGAAITEILDRGRPVTIGQGNVLMNVWNDGLKGGTVRVVTNPGTAGATEVSFSLGAGEGKSVAMKFIAPDSGALVIHTILPDGTIITNGRTLKTKGESDEKHIAIKNGNGTYQLLWVALNDPRPTVSDAPSNDPSFAVWKQAYIERTGDTSVADPENFDKAFVAYLEAKRVEPLGEMQEKLDKFVDEYGDLLTVLNPVSLTHILASATRGLESATARQDEELIVHFTKLKEAAEGLLNNADDAKADEWKAYIERTTSDPELAHLDYKNVTSANPKNITERLQVDRMAGGSISFKLTEKMMVNFSVDMRNVGLISGQSMPILPNISLQLTGKRASGELINWPSEKKYNSGESVSAMLDAGTYTLRIQDKTSYPDTTYMHASQRRKLRLPTIPVAVEMNQYNSANIEGKISIEGSPKVMPVSMRVAEFISDGSGGTKRNTDYKNVSKLNPNKPVWVVVHGMESYEDTAAMESIARELAAYGDAAGQVVTINWSEAAKALGFTGNDAPWTKPVGEWVANQLLNLGFDPKNINIVGHSHGTYVGYAMANKVMDETSGSQINAFVALDPAGNVPILSGFKLGDMNFANVSRNSVAIEGSLVSGNNVLAVTADIAFQVDSSSTHLPTTEHSLPITVFSSLLKTDRLTPGQNPKFFTLRSFMTPFEYQEETAKLEPNKYRQYYEGIIEVDTIDAQDKYGNYTYAKPKRLLFDRLGTAPEEDRPIIAADPIAH